jgi:outer membrane protein assembly factor BamB
MFQLSSKPLAAKPLWAGTKKTSLGLSNTVAVFDNGYLYGADYQSGALICVDAKDGTRKWQTALATVGQDRTRGGSNGAAYLIKASGFYYIMGENGDVVSAVLSPKEYRETGRFHAIDPTNTSNGRDILWTFPAIADGHLLVRNDLEIRCFVLAK